MRIESSVTSISWIPSEAVEGLPKLPFDLRIARYDEPPPDRLAEDDLERLRDEDRFREANHLAAWIEVEDGRIVGHRQEGGGFFGSTRLGAGAVGLTIPRVGFDVLRPPPKVYENGVRFVQTVGGRAGFPVPRRVSGRPFARIESATTWTTLELTICTDGSSFHDVAGASPFPRHWIYDRRGELVEKVGAIDFEAWYREADGERTPWGDEDSEPFVTAAETALEREISRELMEGKNLSERIRLETDQTLVEQGEEASDLYLLLDGVLVAEVDGQEVAEIGPGAIVGERAFIERGKRTATLYARTPCRVAVIPRELIDRQELEDLAAGRGAT